MANISVVGPDNQVFSFPEGTPQNVMHQALTTHYNELGRRMTPAYTPQSEDEAAVLAGAGVDPFNVGIPEKPFEAKIPSVTEIPIADYPSVKNAVAAKMGIPLTNSTAAVKDILESNIPGGVKYSTDEWGNPVAVVNGKKYYPEGHGLNALSAERGLTQGAIGTGAALLTGAMLPEEAVGAGIYAGAQGAAALGSNVGEYVGSLFSGNKQQWDPGAATVETVFGAAAPFMGKALGALASLGEPKTFAELPRGAKTWLTGLADDYANGKIPVGSEGTANLLLDTLEGHGVALDIVSQKGRPTEGAFDILRTVDQRIEEAPERIRADVDSVIGDQIVNTPEMAESLRAARLANSDELTKFLSDAASGLPSTGGNIVSRIPQDEVKNVVATIDGMLPDSVGKVESTLKYIRNMLVRDPTELEKATGVKEGQEFYHTSPQRLQNTINAISNLIRNGGNAGVDAIRPGELPGLSANVGKLRDNISGVLRRNVTDKNGNLVYDNLMGKYKNIYELGDALELGQNVLNKGDYVNGDVHALLDQFLANPETANAVKVGARDAVNTKIGLNAKDTGPLSNLNDSENNFINQSLAKIFGDNTGSRLVNIADRENSYVNNAKELKTAFDQARVATGRERSARTRQPIISNNQLEAANIPFKQFIAKPLNWGAKKITGQAGPEFTEAQGRILTTPADQLEALRQGVEARQTASRNLNKAMAGVTVGGTAAYGPFRQADGGRIERKSGGSVIDKAADALVSETMRNQKLLANHTEQMLSMPDDAIVQALNVARSVAA
jgi:hypothetical protein